MEGKVLAAALLLAAALAAAWIALGFEAALRPYSPRPPAGELERDIYVLINRERGSRGLQELRWSAYWAYRARRWAGELAVAGELRHSAPPGGVEWGEIIASAGGAGADRVPAAEYVEGWLGSPSHRRVMLNPRYRYVGVGCSCNALRTFCVCVAQFSDRAAP